MPLKVYHYTKRSKRANFRCISVRLQEEVRDVALVTRMLKAVFWLGCRLSSAMYKRSQALKHLPGPKYPFLQGFMALVERKDIHRYATELAEHFGPIFKFRIFCFHVHPSSDPYASFSDVPGSPLVALCASSYGLPDFLR